MCLSFLTSASHSVGVSKENTAEEKTNFMKMSHDDDQQTYSGSLTHPSGHNGNKI